MEERRWWAPRRGGANAPKVLLLRIGAGEKDSGNFVKLGAKARLAFRVHRVKRGDTLSQIASSYHSAPEAILRLNGMRNVKLLRVNSELVIPVPAVSGRPDPGLERQIAPARRGGVASVP